MVGRKKGKWTRRSRNERRLLLTRFGNAGLGVAAFCRREGTGLTHAQCWAHARRALVEAQGAEPQAAAPRAGTHRRVSMRWKSASA